MMRKNNHRFIKEANKLNELEDKKNLVNNHTFIIESNIIQNGPKDNLKNRNNRIVYHKRTINSNNGNKFRKNHTFISSKNNIINSMKAKNNNNFNEEK